MVPEAPVHRPTPERLREAARALQAGDLVVFPTETVYGLGANALDPEAVGRIFEAKGRPQDNPLIVHVADAEAARELVQAWPAEAQRLAEAFWPGPLTLVLPKADAIPSITTAGLDTVALRVPDHPVALDLLAEAQLPVAAPSANRSGRPSPTRVEAARADLGDAVAVYLDGGPTDVGVESTVVSLVGQAPQVLRPGGVPVEALQDVLPGLSVGQDRDERVRSPGTRHRHYAPEHARVHLVEEGGAQALFARANALADQGRRVAIVASQENAPEGADVHVPGSRQAPEAWAHQLFALLRELDEAGYDDIVVEAIPEALLGQAVMDRLRRAAER